MTDPIAESPPEQRARPLTAILLRGGGWVVGGRIITSGGTFVLSVLLARLLPPSGVGSYFVALSIATALAILARFGLERVALTVIANRAAEGDSDAVLQVAKRVLLLGGLSATGTATAVSMFGATPLGHLFAAIDVASLTPFIAMWSLVLAFESLLAEIFRGMNRIPLASMLGGALSRALSVLAFAAAFFAERSLTLQQALLVSILAVGVAVSLALRALLSGTSASSGEPRQQTGYSELLRSAVPLAASNLGFFVLTSVDLWIVGAHLPAESVGQYAIAARLVLLVGSSVTIANAVLPPIIARLSAEGDANRLERVLRGVASVAAVPSGALLLIYILFGGRFLATLYGEPYGMAWPVLAALSAGQLAAVWAGSCGYLLMLHGHLKEVMWTAIAGGLLATVGGLWAVEPFGGTGVAVASALGLIAQQTLMLAVAHSKCGVWTHAGFRPLALALRRTRDTFAR